jgi:hypothetical protein
LALAVLVLLFEKPMHPYEMSGTLRFRNKEESLKINWGSLDIVVESLHRRGLIEVVTSRGPVCGRNARPTGSPRPATRRCATGSPTCSPGRPGSSRTSRRRCR